MDAITIRAQISFFESAKQFANLPMQSERRASLWVKDKPTTLPAVIKPESTITSYDTFFRVEIMLPHWHGIEEGFIKGATFFIGGLSYPFGEGIVLE